MGLFICIFDISHSLIFNLTELNVNEFPYSIKPCYK